MELKHKLIFKIESEIAEFRCLKPTDVNNSYIEGLKNQKEFINGEQYNLLKLCWAFQLFQVDKL